MKADRIPKLQLKPDYWQGQKDAVQGLSPQKTNNTYLHGYFRELRRMSQEGSITIQIRFVSKSYLNGAYD